MTSVTAQYDTHPLPVRTTWYAHGREALQLTTGSPPPAPGTIARTREPVCTRTPTL
jgi:hypothetical protein